MTSAVTRIPSSFARRTSSTLPAVDRCRRWIGAPVSRDSSRSRWTISSSARAGQPGSPSSLQHDPSCITAPALSAADLAVLSEDDVETEGVLHRPAHQLGVLDAGPVVGEQVHAGAGEFTERGELVASAADGDRPARVHIAQSRPDPGVANELDHAAGVGGWVGVGHRHHRRVATEGRSAAAGLDRLGILVARFPEVGVEIDEPGGHETPAWRRGSSRGSSTETFEPTATMRSPSMTTSARRSPSTSTTVPPVMSVVTRESRMPGGRTARPSVRLRRC